MSIFFFFRQTWLRGPHAAPTIEGYWLIKKRIASRTCERQHSRHVFVAHVHEACMCALAAIAKRQQAWLELMKSNRDVPLILSARDAGISAANPDDDDNEYVITITNNPK